MENVYVERTKNKNYGCFSTSVFEGYSQYQNVAIIIHLHYGELLHDYCKYLEMIPDWVSVYVTSSQESILKEIGEKYSYRENMKYRKKNNRGRDISAFLVTCLDVLREYDYVCFVHDKKARHKAYEEDTRLWNRNIWENLLGSAAYISNLLYFFENNPECGLLIPPEPFGGYANSWFGNGWFGNIDETKKLASDLELNVDISEEYPPIALGTAFWCRTKALKKLFDHNWSYDDFPEEPLPGDATISHAIERILPFVAQDAGYYTETVMTTLFAAELFGYLQQNALYASRILFESMGIEHANDLENAARALPRIKIIFKNNDNVYLYGAGDEGKKCLRTIVANGLFPEGFIVSKLNTNKLVDGYQVFEFDNVKDSLSNCGIIVTVADNNMKKEIVDKLQDAGVDNFIFWRT